ncbi:hypothetical protein EJ03DRAFT_69002 [Teratosphaeria nubilosa]|uniref:Uncharacterized protein n=1 Tax=Teratosphaeria nubilosa TaxID=161662 RepID=A0A6G1LLE0_9PEZI|nr:hypothetical protein EJ03DRAFT_69002 [Teratosphaeria nubilosa]
MLVLVLELVGSLVEPTSPNANVSSSRAEQNETCDAVASEKLGRSLLKHGHVAVPRPYWSWAPPAVQPRKPAKVSTCMKPSKSSSRTTPATAPATERVRGARRPSRPLLKYSMCFIPRELYQGGQMIVDEQSTAAGNGQGQFKKITAPPTSAFDSRLGRHAISFAKLREDRHIG